MGQQRRSSRGDGQAGKAAEEVTRWATEFEASKKDVHKWHARGRKIVKRFKDAYRSKVTF